MSVRHLVTWDSKVCVICCKDKTNREGILIPPLPDWVLIGTLSGYELRNGVQTLL